MEHNIVDDAHLVDFLSFSRNANNNLGVPAHPFALLAILKGLFFILMHHIKSRSARVKLRHLLEQCRIDCATNCFPNTYKSLVEIRDNHLKLLSLAGKARPWAWMLPWMESEASRWDDLAEECFIASDQEIKSLVSRIAANM